MPIITPPIICTIRRPRRGRDRREERLGVPHQVVRHQPRQRGRDSGLQARPQRRPQPRLRIGHLVAPGELGQLEGIAAGPGRCDCTPAH
jgi:hypothetical protein